MYKRTLITIGIISILVIGILSLLIGNAYNEHSKKNNFERNRINTTFINSKKLDGDFSRIIGTDSNWLYFAGKDPTKIGLINNNLELLDSIKVGLPNDRSFFTAFEIIVDSEGIDIYGKNVGYMLRCKKIDSVNMPSVGIKLPAPIFTRVVRISPSTLALRGFDSSKRNQMLQKIDLQKEVISAKTILLPTSSDAGFSTDGVLLYDDYTSKILYVQHYENKIYCLDTNLVLIYKGNTIDTTFTNPVQTKKILNAEQEGSLMPSVPLIPVNKSARTNGGLLFVLSSLRADNENETIFNENSIIDIYEIKNGSYKGSLYIPSVDGKYLVDFVVINSKLFALFRSSIAMYSLDLK